jgi:hypothetical protein
VLAAPFGSLSNPAIEIKLHSSSKTAGPQR